MEGNSNLLTRFKSIANTYGNDTASNRDITRDVTNENINRKVLMVNIVKDFILEDIIIPASNVERIRKAEESAHGNATIQLYTTYGSVYNIYKGEDPHVWDALIKEIYEGEDPYVNVKYVINSATNRLDAGSIFA